MKKHLIALTVLTLMLSVNAVNAETQKEDAALDKTAPKAECTCPDKGCPVMEHRKDFPPPPQFKGKHPSKAEMEAKKVEFEKRLKLTDEQKKQIEANRIQDREKIKPIFEELKAKHQEMKKIDSDTTLSAEEKAQKKDVIRQDIKELKLKADNCRKENMQNFESILTEKQKKEFTKIKEEQQKEMEKRKQHFEKKKGKDFKGPKGPAFPERPAFPNEAEPQPVPAQ